MSTQMTSDTISSIAPPMIAPTRDIPSAIACKRPINPPTANPSPRSGAPENCLRRRCLQSERLTHGLVPLLGAFAAATLGPAGEHRPLEPLHVRLRLLGPPAPDGGL